MCYPLRSHNLATVIVFLHIRYSIQNNYCIEDARSVVAGVNSYLFSAANYWCVLSTLLQSIIYSSPMVSAYISIHIVPYWNQLNSYYIARVLHRDNCAKHSSTLSICLDCRRRCEIGTPMLV